MDVPAWGEPGAPILPKRLREIWSEQQLPPWMAEDLRVEKNTTFLDLDAHLWDHLDRIPQRVQTYLRRRLDLERPSLANELAVGHKVAHGFPFDELPWSTRVSTCFRKHPILSSPDALRNVTFGDLLRLRGMGVKSVLEYLGTLESAAAALGLDTFEAEPDTDLDAFLAEHSETLLGVIEEPWSEMVSRRDPRFSDVLSAADGTLFDRIDRLTSGLTGRFHYVEELGLLAEIEGVRERLGTIDLLRLEEALWNYCQRLTGWTDERVSALMRRHGWAEQGPESLQSLAGDLGITRERVRQLMKKAHSIRPGHPVVMPALMRAIDLLSRHTPIKVDDAARLLSDAGISNRPFSAEGVISAAEFCRAESSLSIKKVKGEKFLVIEIRDEPIKLIVSTATKQARASGVSTVAEVCAEVSENRPTSEETVLKVLRSVGKIEFLEDRWFWVPEGTGNRIESLARKMLSVTRPLQLSSIREGIKREIRFRRRRGRGGWELLVPPTRVLRKFLESHPGFTVDSESNVFPTDFPEYRSELMDAEQIIVETIRASPSGVVDRATILSEGVQRGANANTLSVMITYSAVVQHLGTDLWTVRGSEVDATRVEAYRSANAYRSRTTRTVGYCWTEDGLLSVAIRLPDLTVPPVPHLPSATHRFLAGKDFEASSGGLPRGRIRVYDTGQSTGYHEFLERSGAEEGDIMVLDFDLILCNVSLRLEADDLLDDTAYEG